MAKRHSIAGAIRAAAHGTEPVAERTTSTEETAASPRAIQGPDAGGQEDDSRAG